MTAASATTTRSCCALADISTTIYAGPADGWSAETTYPAEPRSGAQRRRASLRPIRALAHRRLGCHGSTPPRGAAVEVRAAVCLLKRSWDEHHAPVRRRVFAAGRSDIHDARCRRAASCHTRGSGARAGRARVGHRVWAGTPGLRDGGRGGRWRLGRRRRPEPEHARARARPPTAGGRRRDPVRRRRRVRAPVRR